MPEIITAVVVGLAMSMLILLVYREDRKESKRLAGLARRMGLKFSRKDRFGIGRMLKNRFGMRSPVRYGWVRDVMSDSRIRLFRCNEVFTRKVSVFSRRRTATCPSVGVTADAPEGVTITIEAAATEVRYAYRPHPRMDMRSEYRVRAVDAYLKAHPAPYGLSVYLFGETMFACYRHVDEPNFNKDYVDGDYRYLADFAYDVFNTKMGDIKREA